MKRTIALICTSLLLSGCGTATETSSESQIVEKEQYEELYNTSSIENEIKTKIMSTEYPPKEIELVLLNSLDTANYCSIHSSWPETTGDFLEQCYFMIPEIISVLDSHQFDYDQIIISTAHADNSSKIIKLTYKADDDILLVDNTDTEIIMLNYTYEELDILELAKTDTIEENFDTPKVDESKEESSNYIVNLQPESSSPAEQENDIITETVGQENALRSAKAYLDFSAFSYQGLIDQLEYEKFTHEDAVYAVDNCNADWNEQALKSAQSYLDYSAFSYSGLIQQLEYEKYTTEQATYGADNCGADWNEQAAKSAQSYLAFSSFSRDSLIEQLVYEGFTNEQAVYGVEANGY